MDHHTSTSVRPAPAGLGTGVYRLRQADTASDLRAVQRLRFLVFNLELQEGLQRSFASGLDVDEFDAVCDHLLVEDHRSGEVVGTYRMQTGRQAARHHGYYCEREFDFAPFEPLRDGVLELGRACIHAEHRSFAVLSLLWRGITSYAQERAARYLLGCSSLTSQSAAVGAAAYAQLQAQLAPPVYRTQPNPGFGCSVGQGTPCPPVHLPKLLSSYLALGAWICGPPAIDREFGTIDFLTLLDLLSPEMVQRRRRFGIHC